MKKLILNKNFWIVLLILFLYAILLISLRQKRQALLTNANISPTPSGQFQTHIYYEESDIPKGDTITINGVSFKNFYKENLPLGHFGEVLIFNENHIKIFYFPDRKVFSIPISAAPFSDYQPLAEQAFLNRLNISKEDACKLNVFLSTAVGIDSKEGGIDHRLSWCE
jgi:hypothetical protein